MSVLWRVASESVQTEMSLLRCARTRYETVNSDQSWQLPTSSNVFQTHRPTVRPHTGQTTSRQASATPSRIDVLLSSTNATAPLSIVHLSSHEL